MVTSEIERYLALHGSEVSYTSQLFEDFLFLAGHEYYHQALNIYHLLFMTVIYQTIIKAREWRTRKFKDATILVNDRNFSRDEVLKTNLAFDFSIFRESRFIEFLRLFDADNQLIGDCKKMVKDRNERSHANGNYFSEANLFEEAIAEYDRLLARISELYNEYLHVFFDEHLENIGNEDTVTRDDLELGLISPQKLSLSDLSHLHLLCESDLSMHICIRSILEDDYGIE